MQHAQEYNARQEHRPVPPSGLQAFLQQPYSYQSNQEMYNGGWQHEQPKQLSQPPKMYLEHRAQGHPGMSGAWAGGKNAAKGKPKGFGPNQAWYGDGPSYGLAPKGGA